SAGGGIVTSRCPFGLAACHRLAGSGLCRAAVTCIPHTTGRLPRRGADGTAGYRVAVFSKPRREPASRHAARTTACPAARRRPAADRHCGQCRTLATL